MIHHLDLLGAAALDDASRRAAIGALLRCEVQALEGTVEPVAYDVPSITTVGRWWVRGTARSAAGIRPFASFVKAVQPWSHSPLFQQIPAEHRELAAASYPWRTEPAVYRSDLPGALPPGLRMPRAGAVVELDGALAVMWLEAVGTPDRSTDPDPRANPDPNTDQGPNDQGPNDQGPNDQGPNDQGAETWDEARYARAAYLLGRLAASDATRERAHLGNFPLLPSGYVEGRATMQLVPILQSGVWHHPGLAAFAELREPLLARLPELDAIATEIEALPVLAGHGDACPNNLLPDPADPDGFVLIDFGMWNALPLAHDLTQLLVGDVQIGRRPAAALGGLASLSELLLAAYAEGLAAEGTAVDPATLRRAHALQLFLFAGLSSLPFELLEGPPEALAEIVDARAEVTRFSLDLLARTA